ncbi:MAG: hypothetical protein ACLQNE_31245 [Thermoguttaceae bacterium]
MWIRSADTELLNLAHFRSIKALRDDKAKKWKLVAVDENARAVTLATLDSEQDSKDFLAKLATGLKTAQEFIDTPAQKKVKGKRAGDFTAEGMRNSGITGTENFPG